jgi:tetratricopeptide (TPR) repeat protein
MNLAGLPPGINPAARWGIPYLGFVRHFPPFFLHPRLRGVVMLRSLGKLLCNHPKTTALVLALVVLVGTGAGLYAYTLHQWDAARRAVKVGRPAKARASLDLCLLIWPRSVPVQLLAARCARLRGDFTEADAHLKRCLRLQGGASEDVQVEFLLMRVQTGEVDDVADDLFRFVENKHPESSLIMETIARAYMDKLRFGPALACLNRWIEASPDEAKPYHWRGWVFERLEETELAIKDYQRALELSPDLIAVRLRLAEIMLEQADPPEALVYLEPLSKQFPDNPEVIALLGRCRFLQGQTEEAGRLMEAAVKQRPEDGPLLNTLARLNLGDGKAVEAEQWARQALKADSTDAEAENTLAASLRAQGRLKEADAAQEQHEKDKVLLRKVNRMLGEDADPKHPTRNAGDFYEVGAVCLRGGQERQAEYWLNRALALDPGHQPTLKALAEITKARAIRRKPPPIAGDSQENRGRE